MKILIISTFFPPLNSIASLRPYSWAKYWSAWGHEVTVLTTEKNVDHKTALLCSNKGFKIISIPLPPWISKLKKESTRKNSENNRSLLSKLTHWLRFKRGIFNATRMPDLTHFWIKPATKAVAPEGPWDLIISTAGPYPVHLAAAKLKRQGLAKQWIADYRDTWSNNYIYRGIFPFNWIESLLERKILLQANAITTVSDRFTRTFKRQFPSKTVITVENGFDPSDLEALNPENIFPNDGRFRIVHTGSIYLNKRDPSPLFEAIAQLDQEGICLDHLEVLFVGMNQANLEELITHYQVTKWVKIKEFCSREDALRMQRDADLLLFLPWNDPSIDGILTGKIFEYLYSMTPIIAVGSPLLEASQALIEAAEAGYLLPDTKTSKKFLHEYLESIPVKSKPKSEVLDRYRRDFLAQKLLSEALCLAQ